MKQDSVFKRIAGAEPEFTIDWNGKAIPAVRGETLAACLLVSGIHSLQPEESSEALRGPFCMMGACYACRVLVDGVVCQACMTEVRSGMCVEPLARVRGLDDE